MDVIDSPESQNPQIDISSPIGQPPLSFSEQTKEDQQQLKKPVDLELIDRDLQEIDDYYDDAPSALCQKVDQTQCPTKRRSLLFKDIQQKISEEETGVQNVSGNAWFPTSPPYNVQVTESSSLNKPVIHRSGLLANMTNPSLCWGENEDCPVKVQKPSGIGLHLNRIVSSMHGCGTVLGHKSSERSSPNTVATYSVSNMNNHASETYSASTKRFKGISANSNDNKHDDHTLIVATPASSFPTYIAKALDDTDLSLPIDIQSNLCDNGTRKPEIAGGEDLSSPSPRKKRKKVPDTVVSNSGRRCNCRRTKCLKLYCDCFAAGLFCDELCACQGCWNTELYEDTISNIRQQIQSRNPLAFVPKIQQDDGTCSTPSSARHKRGCNCKKSKCLKKYCECYQANIGCSDGCRCEGCENVIGRKGEYAVKKDSILKQGTGEATDFYSDVQREMVALQNDLSIRHNMTPIAPSTQFPTYAEGAASSWYSSGNYLTSPGATIVTPYGMPTGSTFHANSHDINNEMISLAPFDMQYDPDMDSMNQFSPIFNEPGNLSLLSAIPNSQNWVTSTNDQIQTARSVHRHTSPIDPINRFGGNRFLGTASRVYDIADNVMPEIPAESLTPTDTVKVVSPSKKRVSTRSHETAMSRSSSAAVMTGRSSSATVMTGRKFILQAVPSSTPLTPFIDPEKNDGETKNDFPL